MKTLFIHHLQHLFQRNLPYWFFSFLFSSLAFDALALECDIVGAGNINFLPAVISVGRDASPGDLIGQWNSTTASPAWACGKDNPMHGVLKIGVIVLSSNPIYGTTTADGLSHTIYQTGKKAGLGYILRWRATYKGETSEWQALNGVEDNPPQTMFGPVEYEDKQQFPLNIDIQIQFVKTSNGLTSGNVQAFDIMMTWPYSDFDDGRFGEKGPSRKVSYPSGNLSIVSGGTCTTPNVDVVFPPVYPNTFAGIGSTAGMTRFEIQFNNCPAGLNSIGYYFSPTTSVIDPANGVFSLHASSTAQGVGIQLLTADNTPVVFNSTYVLGDYDPSSSNNYTVPLKAAIYQTDESVTPGEVKGLVTFTLDYK